MDIAVRQLPDTPKEVVIARSSAGGKKDDSYYRDRDISSEAKKEIADILRREIHKSNAMTEKNSRETGKKKSASKHS